jgi:hypothetical protein
MLVSQIKSIFLSKFDQFSSAYISDLKLNNFYAEAQIEVWKGIMASYQLTSRVTEDSLALLKTEVVAPTTNEINMDTDLTYDYNTLINVYPLYKTSKGDIQYAAKPYINDEKLSTFARGTIRYPRFDQYSNSTNQRILLIYPTDVLPNEVKLTYFRDIITIDFASPSTDIPYTNNTINLITDKAIQLASAATRDSEGFQEASALLYQSNTIQ